MEVMARVDPKEISSVMSRGDNSGSHCRRFPKFYDHIIHKSHVHRKCLFFGGERALGKASQHVAALQGTITSKTHQTGISGKIMEHQKCQLGGDM